MGRIIVAVTLLAALAAPASADPMISIVSPASGASVSSAAQDTMAVWGHAAFDAPEPGTRTFYLRQSVCGGEGNDPHMSIFSGADAGNACGYPQQALNEFFARTGQALKFSYPAIDGVPLQFDASGRLKGVITITSGFNVAAGNARTDIDVLGRRADGSVSTIASVSKEYLVTPDKASYEIPIDEKIPSVLDGVDFNELVVDVTMRGVTAPIHGYVELNGRSWLTLPILDAGRVEVSLSKDFPPEATFGAMLEDDGVWELDMATPKPGGRTIYARGIQGGRISDAQPVTFMVTQ